MAVRKAMRKKDNRLLAERPLPRDGRERGHSSGVRGAIPARSVTVNLGESPLGWLRARGLVSDRQFAAGEQIRSDWEKAGMGPSVTMRWDAAPPEKGVRHLDARPGPGSVLAKRRFDTALAAVGPGLGDIVWRTVCAGEGMRDAETALGWPARAGRLVLLMALDRLADHYRLR